MIRFISLLSYPYKIGRSFFFFIIFLMSHKTSADLEYYCFAGWGMTIITICLFYTASYRHAFCSRFRLFSKTYVNKKQKNMSYKICCLSAFLYDACKHHIEMRYEHPNRWFRRLATVWLRLVGLRLEHVDGFWQRRPATDRRCNGTLANQKWRPT